MVKYHQYMVGAEHALDRVLELAVLMNDDMTRTLAKDGLTVSRAHLLWVLRQRGPCTQSVLAEQLGVSARNVTGLVDGLVATGFVTREPHPTDRRATHVSFTERGATTTAVMESDHRELAHTLFADMATGELDHFTRSLGDVLARLRTRLEAEDE